MYVYIYTKYRKDKKMYNIYIYIYIIYENI